MTAAARLKGVAAVLLCALAACASARAGHPGLLAPERLGAVVDSVVTTRPLDRTHWGIAVRDAESGEWLVRLNAERHFIPASNTKLVVTSVALGELGAAYRYETPVFVRAADGDSSAAEVLIIGRGDPTFSARFHETDYSVTDTMADAIAAAGIRRVGDITIDASFFGDRPVHGTWEVADLTEAFAAPVDAFAVGEGTVQLVLAGGESPGRPASVSTVGPNGLQRVAWHLSTDTTGARTRVAIDDLNRTDTIVITGSIAAGNVDTIRVAVTHPARFAARALEFALRTRGIRVDGDIRIVRDSAEAELLRQQLHADYRRITTITSPPLTEIVAAILRPSQNWMAEQLLKTLGAERRGIGGWSSGIDVERRYLIGTASLDSTTFFLRDASGLSAQNLLAPEGIVDLLAHARRQPWGQAWYEALPEPGLEEGTLESRLLPLRGRLRAKTGSITNVNTLSGYVTTNDGRQLIFSVMTNGSGVSAAAVRQGVDRIIEALAAEGGKQ
jgi:D-alanyl-D-alanine carboxypeptidase/D-alanyl-D-alanine-endopeptidase (penicillin-binding protein 4)